MSREEAKPLGWQMKVASLRNVGRMFRLLWATSPPLLASTIVLHLSRATLPIFLLWIPKLIVDRLVAVLSHSRTDTSEIWKLLALEFALALLNDVLGRLITLADSLLGDRFTNQVSVRMMAHAASLDLASFEDPVFYDKLERARGQASGRLVLLTSFLNLGQEAITFATLSASLIVFSPWLMALLVVAMIPAFLGEARMATLAYSVLYRRTPQRRELEYLSFLGASLVSAKEVRIFGLGQHLCDRQVATARKIYEENRALAIKKTTINSALTVISTGGYYVSYVVVLTKALSGAISVGTFVFLTGAFSRSRTSIERVFSSINDISEHSVLLEDLFDFFHTRPAIAAPACPAPPPRAIRDGIEFRRVCFGYPGSARPAVRDMSFRISAGEKVALVGENGSGKTTVVKLLSRLYDPTSGSIILDGVDLREYDLPALRKLYSVIFQDFMRYDLTVSENISFGDIDGPRGDPQRVRNAAIMSGADGVIQRFPKAYDQMLGRRFEGGAEISGGEWQKMALARSYIRDSQILILDEPTASLDARSEFEVFDRLTALMHDRIAILISHRFSTVRMADNILVLADGEIEQQGRHERLLATGGRYAELFELQAAGYRDGLK